MFFSFFRLEERGLVLAREDDGSEDGAGEGTSRTTVLLRTSKKWMDQERYLDATQRCVFVSSRRVLYDCSLLFVML